MNPLRLTKSYFKSFPAMAKLRKQLQACPGSYKLGTDLIVDASCDCVKTLRGLVLKTPPEKVARIGNDAWGPKAWKWLHEWAMTTCLYGDSCKAKAALVLDKFNNSLPCYNKCKPEWLALVARHPPDFSNNEALTNWTFDRHDDVNEARGVARIGREAAWKIWSTDAISKSSAARCH